MRIETLCQLNLREQLEAHCLLPQFIKALKSCAQEVISFEKDYRIEVDSESHYYVFVNTTTDEPLPKISSKSLPVMVTLKTSAIENLG